MRQIQKSQLSKGMAPAVLVLLLLFATSVQPSLASTVQDSASESNNYMAQNVMPVVANELMTVVGNSISNTMGMGAGITGQSSGDGPMQGVGFWLKGVQAGLKSTKTGGEYGGHQTSGMLGVDLRMNRDLLVGLAISKDSLNVATEYNSGTFKGHGTSFFPYAGIKLNNNVLMNLMFGYSNVQYSASHTGITGEFDAKRYLQQVEIRGTHRFGRMQVQPTVELSYFHEKRDGFIESNGSVIPGDSISVGQYGAGLITSYDFGRWTPYVRLRSTYNFTQPDPSILTTGEINKTERLDYSASMGSNYVVTDSIKATMEGSVGGLNQDDLSTWSLTGQLRYEW